MNIKTLQMKKKNFLVLITLLLSMVGMTKVYAYDFTAVTTTGQTLYYSIISNNQHYVKMVYPGNSNNNPWGNIVKPSGTVLLPAMVDYNGITWYVRYIDNYAFYGCFEITEAIISEGINSVGDYSFFGCTGLTTLTIGPTVTSIGDYAFWNCPSLTTVHYNAMNCTEMYTNYSGYHSVFNSGTTATGPTAITTLTIGNGVNRIPNHAFRGSPEILGVSFPQWLTNIGNNAFSDCENLASITLLSTTPPSVGSNAFSNVSLTIPVFVPCNLSGTYIAADGWNQFSNIIELCSNQIVAVAYPSDGGTVTGSGTYATGQICFLTAIPNAGYSFLHWRKNGEIVSTNSTYNFTVIESGSYVAIFRETQTFTVLASINPSQGGYVTGTGYYNQGQTCTLTAIPNAGYTFANWTEDGVVVSTSSNYSFTVMGNRNLVANFTVSSVSYTVNISASPSNAGIVTGGGIFEQGYVCYLNAIANAGYYFVNWTENGTEVSNTANYAFAVMNNRTLVANFALIDYYVTVAANPTNGGTVTGGGSYQQGATCTVTATANEGYYFFSWMENGEEVSASASYSFTVTSNRNLVAFFMANPVNCIINASASPSNGGSISGAGTYPLGQICTLIASANPGYTFMNWTEGMSWEAGGEIISTEASYSFTVTGNWNVVANFSSNENHWMVDVYQYPYNMSVTGVIQIFGEEQNTPTLEIGAFCGDECRGSQRLTYFPQVNRYLVFLTLYGNTGDVMSFRLYDHALGEELDLSCSSNISFVPDGFIGSAIDPYVFNFGNTMVDQVSSFSQGYNWWCTYIEQEGMDGLGLLQEGLGNNGVSIRSQASGYTDYYTGYGWYGSLSSINNESSYRIITSTPCTVTMTGNAAAPSQHPITLSQGWSWIGYVPSIAMSVDVAMTGVSAMQGDKLKSQHGYSEYYPSYGWFGSLNTIEPGMGLMYYSTNGETVTFTYPDSNRGGELKKNLTAEHNHWKPNTFAYPDNMTVMAVVELDNVELSSDNYELAAFTANSECRGSVRLTYAEPLHRHVAFLTISGKDAAELSFRLYDTETGVEYYDAEERLDFVANAIVGDAEDLYTIHFRGTTGVDELANSVQVYPNPVNAGEQFSINVADDVKTPVRVEIVNALGVETLRATSVQVPAQLTAPATAGVYTLRITVEGKGTVVRKLVVK